MDDSRCYKQLKIIENMTHKEQTICLQKATTFSRVFAVILYLLTSNNLYELCQTVCHLSTKKTATFFKEKVYVNTH